MKKSFTIIVLALIASLATAQNAVKAGTGSVALWIVSNGYSRNAEW